jgi:hypothetical protein
MVALQLSSRADAAGDIRSAAGLSSNQTGVALYGQFGLAAASRIGA